VRLWRTWRQGHSQALERLIAYNREDVLNLQFLAEVAYKGLTHLALTGKPPDSYALLGAELARPNFRFNSVKLV
jgi:hypothetical protein